MVAVSFWCGNPQFTAFKASWARSLLMLIAVVAHRPCLTYPASDESRF
jgi:hypothetical protein